MTLASLLAAFEDYILIQIQQNLNKLKFKGQKKKSFEKPL
jgi:hypothetical protein